MKCKYLCIYLYRELPHGGMVVWSSRWEWAFEGEPKGKFLLSRGDGDDNFVMKCRRMLVRYKWAQCVKPGGTAGMDNLSCPSRMLGAAFLLPLIKGD